MSYPNLGAYNSSQMNYGGQPNSYGTQQPGGYPGGAYGYGGQQPGNFPPQGPGGPGAPGGPGGPGHQGGVSPEVQQWFNAVDRDRSGKISAKELQAALVNGQGKNFSDQACNLMIGIFDMDESGMFDRDKTGTIDINEFQQLYNYINQWLGTFRSYDRDQSGHIDESELSQAFQQMGFRFSPEFIKFLITKSDVQDHAKISVDQFIVLCVQVQKFTEKGSDMGHHSLGASCDQLRRKRKHKNEEVPFHLENGSRTDDDNFFETGTNQIYSRLQNENQKLKEDMNQLVNENVHLLKENKQLQEENCTLEDKLRSLNEENDRLRKEHRDALELSSWLSSARQIVEALQKKPVVFPKPPRKLSPIIRPVDILNPCQRPPHLQSRKPPELKNAHLGEEDMPHSNGAFITPHIKMEKADEDHHSEGGQESPYHTPLLNFDQVEFHSSDKEGCELSINNIPDITPSESVDEIDRIGREQLLFPEPVEGVCELCPGSRIYVALSAMDNILSKKSHSSVARSCLEAIFKMPFLLSCSVQGNIAKGPYGKPDVQRPSLYRPAVECILNYARYHAEQNGWKVEENTTIKKQMNTRLSELRNIAKYKAASAESGDSEHKGFTRYKNIVAALSALPIVAQPTSSEGKSELECRSDSKGANSKSVNFCERV